jgi:hypothetical protein
MTPRKNEPPLVLDMDFEEALQRFSGVAPKELLSEEQPLELVQYEGAREQFLVFGADSGPQVQIRFESEPWFTQRQLAEMFGVSVPTVNEHVNKFLSDGELDDSVIRKFRITAVDGKSYDVQHYTLDVAFYVGYRVNSSAGVLFRKWATDVLIRYAKNGFVVDVRRLKEPEASDRVKELREIVRDIRASEANVYREVRDLCALVKDYASGSREWQAFYARMQNKLLWAVVQATATQLRLERANAEKPNMGLTFWSGYRILQKDTLTAKNYLAHGEAEEMNRLSVMLLDFFEDQLKIGVIVTMDDLESALDRFITNMNRSPLPKRGLRIPTKTEADTHCKGEYKRFSELRAMGEPEPDTRYLEGGESN